MLLAPESGRDSVHGCDAPIAVITGGTGLVGAALARQLAFDLPDHQLVLLARRRAQIDVPRATAVYADVTRPDLGLDAAATRMLKARADLFFHCAADTRFNLPLEHSRRVNTQGTRNVMQLARACRNLTHFAHISTLYVAGRREGLVREQPLNHTAGYVNSYETSKHEAEELVLRESPVIPVGMYRLSSVADLAGNNGHFRQVIRFASRSGEFPFFPADRGVPVDLISSDWAARAICALVTCNPASGCIRHICAGERNALTVGNILEKASALYQPVAESSNPRLTLVSLAEFEHLRAKLRPDSFVARALAHLATFLPHLSLHQPFDDTVTSRLLAERGVPQPDMHSLVCAILRQEFSSSMPGSCRNRLNRQ